MRTQLLVIYGFLALLQGAYAPAPFNVQAARQLDRDMERCARETKIDINVLRSFDPKDKIVISDDLKCFFKCLFVKFNFMDQEGNIITENHADDVKNCKTKIKVVPGQDSCDVADELRECLHESILLSGINHH